MSCFLHCIGLFSKQGHFYVTISYLFLVVCTCRTPFNVEVLEGMILSQSFFLYFTFSLGYIISNIAKLIEIKSDDPKLDFDITFLKQFITYQIMDNYV